MPVGSAALAREHRLGVSPATIRNEMVQLEEDGYITRPHASAGGVPSDKGYRFFVERLPRNTAPPVPARRALQDEMERVRRDMERWAKAASSVVSGIMRTVAFATAPRASTTRVKQLELLQLQELTALLVLILHGATVHKQLIPLERPTTREALENIRNRLAALVADRTAREIEARRPATADDLEKDVIDATVNVLRSEEDSASSMYEMDGLAELFSQPEFSEPGHGRDLVGALEEEGAVSAVADVIPEDGSVRVLIGSEIGRESMHSFSVVACRYGVPGQASGAVGIIGPTRLRYDRAIPVVDHAASLLSDLVAELYPGHTSSRDIAAAR